MNKEFTEFKSKGRGKVFSFLKIVHRSLSHSLVKQSKETKEVRKERKVFQYRKQWDWPLISMWLRTKSFFETMQKEWKKFHEILECEKVERKKNKNKNKKEKCFCRQFPLKLTHPPTKCEIEKKKKTFFHFL